MTLVNAIFICKVFFPEKECTCHTLDFADLLAFFRDSLFKPQELFYFHKFLNAEWCRVCAMVNGTARCQLIKSGIKRLQRWTYNSFRILIIFLKFQLLGQNGHWSSWSGKCSDGVKTRKRKCIRKHFQTNYQFFLLLVS